jgi:hypothetical protein
MTTASTPTVTHGRGTFPRNAAKRTKGSVTGTSGVVVVMVAIVLLFAS